MKKLLLILIFVLCAVPAWADTHYVSATGTELAECNDAGDGTKLIPYCTLSGALAEASVADGDTILLQNGETIAEGATPTVADTNITIGVATLAATEAGGDWKSTGSAVRPIVDASGQATALLAQPSSGTTKTVTIQNIEFLGDASTNADCVKTRTTNTGNMVATLINVKASGNVGGDTFTASATSTGTCIVSYTDCTAVGGGVGNDGFKLLDSTAGNLTGTYTNCTASGYTAAATSDGISLHAGEATVNKCTFTGNYNGVGIFEGATFTATDSIIHSNTSVGFRTVSNGTGTATASFTRCKFYNNGSHQIDMQEVGALSSVTATNCLFYDIPANMYAVKVTPAASTMKLYNCTISGNDANSKGVYFADGTANANTQIKNTVFASCLADSYIEFATVGNSASLTTTNCAFDVAIGDVTAADLTGATHTGNVYSATVGFFDAANDLYWLTAASGCIGTGSNLGASYDDGIAEASTWPSDVRTTDRDDHVTWDIGAYVAQPFTLH